jgi:hypothetical protein
VRPGFGKIKVPWFNTGHTGAFILNKNISAAVQNSNSAIHATFTTIIAGIQIAL